MRMGKLYVISVVCILLVSCRYEQNETVTACETFNLLVDTIIGERCTLLGSIQLSVVGGSDEIRYRLETEVEIENTTGVFTGLRTDNYTVSATDDRLCTATLNFTVSNICSTTACSASGLQLTLDTVIHETCDAKGEIRVAGSGGQGNLLFSIEPTVIQQSNVFSALDFGNYVVQVIDEQGCGAELSVAVLDSCVPPVPSLEKDIMPLVNANCAVSTCHGGGVFPNLTTKQQVITNAASIRNQVVVQRTMPRGVSFLESQRILFAEWIDAGSPDN